jgi:hypothetical protein
MFVHMKDVKIEVGDLVKHSNPYVNGTFPIPVLKINDDETMVRCNYFASADQIHKDEWLKISDLSLFQKADGTLVI